MGEIQDGSARTEFEAAAFATLCTSGRRRGVDEKLSHELTLLRRYLNSVAAAFTDVDQPVLGEVNTVEDRKPLGRGPETS